MQRDKRAKSIAVAQNVMNRIGMQLVAEKKAAILKAPEGKMTGNEKDLHTRDLLTLLIKANMATDIPESQRLSDKDMLARTSPITSDLYQYSLGINTQRSQRKFLFVVVAECAFRSLRHEIPCGGTRDD